MGSRFGFSFLIIIVGVLIEGGLAKGWRDECSLAFAKSVGYTGEDYTDNLLRDAMSREGLEEMFGAVAVESAVLFDETTGDYSGRDKVGIKNIQFVLYTRQNMEIDNGTEIFLNLEDHLLHYGYDPKAPTKIISHGFNSDYMRGPGGTLAPAYFNATPADQPLNIILLNWASMAGVHKTKPPSKPLITANGTLCQYQKQWYDLFYFPPARNTKLVGEYTGALVKFLVETVGTNLSDVHLIGHSLGAHVMGYAGRYVESKLGDKVSRITGLDPAGPCFESWRFACFRGPYERLRESDAEFVDVIHTNAGGFGMKARLGHIDFYPNSGFKQPGCNSFFMTPRAICAHTRCVDLMRDSILYPKQGFQSLKCENWDHFAKGDCHNSSKTFIAAMGEPCTAKYPEGIYFLRTNSKEPFNFGINTI